MAAKLRESQPYIVEICHFLAPPLFCDRYRGQLENGSLFPLNLEENLRERDIGAARKWQSFSQL